MLTGFKERHSHLTSQVREHEERVQMLRDKHRDVMHRHRELDTTESKQAVRKAAREHKHAQSRLKDAQLKKKHWKHKGRFDGQSMLVRDCYRCRSA